LIINFRKNKLSNR